MPNPVSFTADDVKLVAKAITGDPGDDQAPEAAAHRVLELLSLAGRLVPARYLCGQQPGTGNVQHIQP